MALQRRQWQAWQGRLDVGSLVFVDETGADTKMVRTHGRAPRGQRCVGPRPYGHWRTTTLLAGLRAQAVSAPVVLDGPIDGASFLAWVEQFLCPTLGKGDLVIADNLPSHKVAGVEEAITAVGARLIYLPPYSPDLNPIEKLFSKLKALLNKAAARTRDDLWQQIGQILNCISPQECANYFKSAGYAS